MTDAVAATRRAHIRLDDFEGQLKSIWQLRQEYRAQAAARAKKRAKGFVPGPGPELVHGWMLNYLVAADAVTWQRWAYWMYLSFNEGRLPPEPIPFMDFETVYPGSEAWEVRKMIERCLEAVSPGGWQGWSTWDYFDYVLSWLLFGFGATSQPELPKEPTAGACYRLFQSFDLDAMILWPADYWGDLFAEARIGKGVGFFATPQNLASMMADIVSGEASDTGHFVYPDTDRRLLTVQEPCVGTGRMLLAASNYHLSMAGQDVNPLCCKATLVNLFLYAPWGAKPIPWVEQSIEQIRRVRVMMAVLNAPPPTAAPEPEIPLGVTLALPGTPPLAQPHPDASNGHVRLVPAIQPNGRVRYVPAEQQQEMFGGAP